MKKIFAILTAIITGGVGIGITVAGSTLEAAAAPYN
jgi:hypothetical protein